MSFSCSFPPYKIYYFIKAAAMAAYVHNNAKAPAVPEYGQELICHTM